MIHKPISAGIFKIMENRVSKLSESEKAASKALLVKAVAGHENFNGGTFPVVEQTPKRCRIIV